MNFQFHFRTLSIVLWISCHTQFKCMLLKTQEKSSSLQNYYTGAPKSFMSLPKTTFLLANFYVVHALPMIRQLQQQTQDGRLIKNLSLLVSCKDDTPLIPREWHYSSPESKTLAATTRMKVLQLLEISVHKFSIALLKSPDTFFSIHQRI